MNKIRVGFIMGATVLFLGVLLAFRADDLATNWQMIGSNAWGGTTDPDKSHLYQIMGLLTAMFGLFLTGATFYQWLSHPKATLSGSEQERSFFAQH